MDLKEYEQKKFSIAEILRSLTALTPEENRKGRQTLLDLQARLAEDRFNLVVVGRFNRGKSSLMNALLGMDRLPTGIVPLTSVITTVTYGSREQLVIRYENSGINSRVQISRLREFVTEEGNPSNRKGVQIAEIQLPSELLRRGFFFVDTPGLGSPIFANTRTTEMYLPEADSFILVSGYESPMSEEELKFLQNASRSPKRIFIVLNKQDIVGKDDRQRAMAYVKNQLQERLPGKLFPVFSVSAREGLDAVQADDRKKLEDSGIAMLEAELQRFLIEDKQHEFLIQVCARIGEFIAGLPDSEQKAELLQGLRAISGGLEGSQPGNSQTATLIPVSVGATALKPCEICEHIHARCQDFLRQYQYDLVTNQKVQQRHAEVGGFCAMHTWQYESMASPQGICTGYPLLLEHLSQIISKQASGIPYPKDTDEDSGVSLPPSHCPLCEISAQACRDAIGTFFGQAEDNGSQELSAFCLPHLYAVCRRTSNTKLVQQLLEHASRLLLRVSEDMKRYVMKRDGIRQYLATEEENLAHLRGLYLLAGKRSLAKAPQRSV